MSTASAEAGLRNRQPGILIGTWVAIALPLVATVLAVALGSFYLISS